MRQNLRSIFVGITIAVISTVSFTTIFLFCIEAYLQFTDSTPPLAKDDGQRRLSRDKDLGWNSVNEIATIGPGDSSLQIVFSGDSFTHYPRAQWPSHTLRRLSAEGTEAQGHVLGVAGYGTLQSYLKLSTVIEKLEPNAIILFVYLWNDLRDNIDTPGIYYNPMTRTRPVYRETNRKGFYINPTPLPPWILGSQIYRRLIIDTETTLHENLRDSFDVDSLASSGQRTLFNYTDTRTWIPFYRRSTDQAPYVRLAYRGLEASLLSFRDLANQYRATLLVGLIDNAFTVDQDVADEWFKGHDDLDKLLPLQNAESILTRLGIEHLNFQPLLKSHAEATRKKVYNGPPGNLSGHLEPEAEQLVGEKIADLLLSRKLLQPAQ